MTQVEVPDALADAKFGLWTAVTVLRVLATGNRKLEQHGSCDCKSNDAMMPNRATAVA